ncbi:1-phosphofructokinase [Alteribacter natronophilus]|uniref:1-phosphofructokinase n=1 Tax=Alteribacter natronophilus TaxID=2583810 RepID=UPI00110D9A11|nr:1-phosphofructokinase [Alteribacter natronophilus]TMW71823.1 1-phosphofructokinase [Alteribacter natronophilus]
MIYTVTMNPSADYFMSVPAFETGVTNRAEATRIVPGGKGINVSRVLTNLGIENQALGFLAGFTGQFIESALKKEKLNTDFYHTEGMTRINVKLETTEETEINGTGCRISLADERALLKRLETIQEGDTVVLAGSIPAGAGADIYKKAVETVNRRGARAVLDTSGLPLKEAIAAEPYLIKPNASELEELAGKKLSEFKDILEAAMGAVHAGARHVLVSLGGEGALLVTENGVLSARPPEGSLVNSVGAGDSMVAGFLYGLEQGLSPEECLPFAVASGSATAFSEGFCTKEQIERLVNSVDIRQMEEEEK